MHLVAEVTVVSQPHPGHKLHFDDVVMLLQTRHFLGVVLVKSQTVATHCAQSSATVKLAQAVQKSLANRYPGLHDWQVFVLVQVAQPVGQLVQVEAVPPSEKVPAVQATHTFEVNLKPAGHLRHLVAGPAQVVHEGEQGKQEVAPAAENVPAVQSVQVADPGLLENLFAGQLVQEVAPAAENLPAAHSPQEVAPELDEKVPAAHERQPDPAVEYLPAVQGVQELAPAADPLPAGQSVH